MILWVSHYDTMSAVLDFYQTMVERRTVLESSSFADSKWSMGGINITHLAATPKYPSTTPEIVPGCQTLGGGGNNTVLTANGAVLLHPWGVNLESLEHTSKTSNKHSAKQEQFPSLKVLLHTKLTWY